MKWVSADIEMYMKAREYVDTVIVPLIPITFKGDMIPTVEMGEFISILASELEREYKGRLIVLPAFTYLREEEPSTLINRVNLWNNNLLQDGIKNVVLLTSDSDWKLNEKDVQATLLWVPSISFKDLDKKYIEQMVKSQMKSIHSLVINLWKKES
ncbi:Protein of unknown function (DUF2487) [Schinkia azotoformans MEV2011]|uniref:DUF2487 domain-containing protein n=2 Tax=Schinkia azotoformans TaxID=1454 RepID=K6DGW2_SCHAZ|nr:YpiF family protein [Schinkia azotoformans]EKN67338.1 hypothetical protein BAZO_09256 [Schinkia azotoformans LMG 9581]KEF40528.1 Protein of unknown function (DUF2487) [Schinkia azotoformans MEV2011]MEC1639409.1 YpiF family protein [Schinkia azotoformans]MEC1696065.1 YpiF family protein [Schinkia azotoformans]MEC1716721.1 YpiF family protein [Schinkia azotoformans]